MSTLQKIEEVGAKIEELEQKVTALENFMIGATNAIKSIVDGTNSKTKELSETDNIIVNRLMGIEQAHSSLSKMLSAIVSELSDAGGIDQTSVMSRLRKAEEAADKARIEQMVQLGVITSEEETTPTSLIVVSQKFTNADGNSENISDFRSYELGSELLEESVREKYACKPVGSVVDLDVNGGTLSTTILSSYSFVAQNESKGNEGEGETVGA